MSKSLLIAGVAFVVAYLLWRHRDACACAGGAPATDSRGDEQQTAVGTVNTPTTSVGTVPSFEHPPQFQPPGGTGRPPDGTPIASDIPAPETPRQACERTRGSWLDLGMAGQQCVCPGGSSGDGRGGCLPGDPVDLVGNCIRSGGVPVGTECFCYGSCGEITNRVTGGKECLCVG